MNGACRMARDLDGQKVAKINEFKENLLSIFVIDRIKLTRQEFVFLREREICFISKCVLSLPFERKFSFVILYRLERFLITQNNSFLF